MGRLLLAATALAIFLLPQKNAIDKFFYDHWCKIRLRFGQRDAEFGLGKTFSKPVLGIVHLSAAQK